MKQRDLKMLHVDPSTDLIVFSKTFVSLVLILCRLLARSKL